MVRLELERKSVHNVFLPVKLSYLNVLPIFFFYFDAYVLCFRVAIRLSLKKVE